MADEQGTASAALPAHPAGRLHLSTRANAAHLSRLHRRGAAVKVAAGVYLEGVAMPLEVATRHHVWTLIAHYWPGAVVCDRTAFDAGSTDWIFICHPEPPRTSDLVLPGVTVSCRVGPGPLPGDMGFHGLHMSGVARGLLENAKTVGRPGKNRPSRPAGLVAVGDRIDELATTGDGSRLKVAFAAFDEVRGYFEPSVVETVRVLLAAASGTYSGESIASERLQRRVDGSPVDVARLDLFARAAAELSRLAPLARPALGPQSQRRWLPFFEAYFSNYIEGTRFTVDEAYAIAIDGDIPAARPKDAHDVSGTYRIVNDVDTMCTAPRDADDLVEMLRTHHRVLMAGRPEKQPGTFKTQPNYAGMTKFVDPTQVEGTLRAGWEHIADTVDPFHRAVLMMFLVTECHPFDDGNGRIARIVTNIELVACGEHRVVIPTCYRNNYLATLSGATNGNGVAALVSALDFSRRWVAAVDWSDWDRCRADLDESNAFEEPAVAEHSGRRLRLPGPPG
jgi:hypothetical protein